MDDGTTTVTEKHFFSESYPPGLKQRPTGFPVGLHRIYYGCAPSDYDDVKLIFRHADKTN